MHERSLDLRGLTCPEPVLKAKAVLDDKAVDRLVAHVDDQVSVQNLDRLAKYFKAHFSFQPSGNGFQVIITRSGEAGQGQKVFDSNQPLEQSKRAGTIIFIAKDSFGQGDADFSRSLLNVFLQTTLQAGHHIQAILLANSGVKLMAKDSPCATVFADFQRQGTEVLACGLCLEYYGLVSDIAKSQITNMFAIVEYLLAAEKVISP